MRLTLLSLLAVVSLGALAENANADRYVRTYSRPVYRTNTTRVYTGRVSPNRRVYTRSHVYVNNGHYRVHDGTSFQYRRPYISRRYYDFRVRPTVIVENYPSRGGYIWVSGHWNWSGSEWLWVGGHYAPDPAVRTYYDDGSFE
jgi:hypothetical protein